MCTSIIIPLLWIRSAPDSSRRLSSILCAISSLVFSGIATFTGSVQYTFCMVLLFSSLSATISCGAFYPSLLFRRQKVDQATPCSRHHASAPIPLEFTSCITCIHPCLRTFMFCISSLKLFESFPQISLL